MVLPGIGSASAAHAAVVSGVKAVTWLGSSGVLWTLTGTAAVVLAIRRRWRLVIYLLVTGAGELTLDPVLKALVGRLRPVVAHPIAYGNGDSFPSGHALGSFVCYGALFLVFLPAARGTWRRVFIVVICTLIAAIGISRLLLGVHYLSDVLGAWALGITWLGITAFAFELSRQATGAPVTDPVTEGLEPEARADLKPAEPETTMHHDRARRYGRIAAGVVVIWDDVPGRSRVAHPSPLRSLLKVLFPGYVRHAEQLVAGPDAYDTYGFRVPAVIVSPFARPDCVLSDIFDHTSVLKLIEEKWNLPALTRAGRGGYLAARRTGTDGSAGVPDTAAVACAGAGLGHLVGRRMA